MWRRLFLFFAAVVVIAGSIWLFSAGHFFNDPPEEVRQAQPDGNISQIEFVSLTAAGCDGESAVFYLAFKSAGAGTVDITAVRAEDNVIASRIDNLPIAEDQPITTVRLVMSEGVDGEAIIQVKAANYDVNPGEKGDQTAINQKIYQVANATCAYNLSSNQGRLVMLACILAAVAAIILIWFFLLRPLINWMRSKKRKTSQNTEPASEEATKEGTD